MIKYKNNNTGEEVYIGMIDGTYLENEDSNCSVEVLEFTYFEENGTRGIKSEKTVDEIMDAVRDGKHIVARATIIDGNMWQQLNIGNIQNAEDGYRLIMYTSTEPGESAICLAATEVDDHFVVTY